MLGSVACSGETTGDSTGGTDSMVAETDRDATGEVAIDSTASDSRADTVAPGDTTATDTAVATDTGADAEVAAEAAADATGSGQCIDTRSTPPKVIDCVAGGSCTLDSPGGGTTFVCKSPPVFGSKPCGAISCAFGSTFTCTCTDAAKSVCSCN